MCARIRKNFLVQRIVAEAHSIWLAAVCWLAWYSWQQSGVRLSRWVAVFYVTFVWYSGSVLLGFFSVFCLFLVCCFSCSVQKYLEPVWFSSSSSFSKNNSVLHSIRSKSFPVVLSRERLCVFCIIVFCWSLGSLPVFFHWCVHIGPRPRFLAGYDYLLSFFDFFLLVLLGGTGWRWERIFSEGFCTHPLVFRGACW